MERIKELLVILLTPIAILWAMVVCLMYFVTFFALPAALALAMDGEYITAGIVFTYFILAMIGGRLLGL